MANQKVSVIIPAAGISKRYSSSVKKQFAELGGKPLLNYSVKAFELNENINEIIVVTHADDIKEAKRLLINFKKITNIVPGGKERQFSVKNGFKSVSGDTDIVLIHDAARPFISNNLINKIITECMVNKAVILAIPITDTVKEVDLSNLNIIKTVPRESLWRAQTPQAFKYSLLREIYDKLDLDSLNITDESQLAELLGEKIKIINGSVYNLKVTDVNDLRIAESYIKSEIIENV
ncbi:MAG: 2-C-methyl-D-erythritol 4-phosphate cytidylyltransferase [Candidatus Dadabacteria bacterium]|nr:2-C-methyl-D-erythritol 4-phosphate cytidylyltransferase [Candidatus Dadabacteria bacterium]NIQ17091.1 2-C-methyl-D-erythritol 4-phosphate cytidylyltransferase [Candidatus Dadabacteria bacterium]